MNESVKRSSWIDVAKGIGILLVIAGHSTSYRYDSKIGVLITSAIYSVHMPLFFLLAGIFVETSLLRRGYRLFLSEKMRGIVYPYLLFSIFEWTYRYVLGQTSEFRDFLDTRALFYIPLQPIFHYWFLYALLICFLFYAAINKILTKLKPVFWFAVVAIVGYFSASMMVDGIFKLVAPVMIFFAGGIYLGRILHGTSSVKPVLHELALLFAVMAVIATFAFLLGEKSDIVRLLAKMACAVIGIALISYFASWLPEGEAHGVLSYLGKNSMAIYLLHIPPMALAMYVLSSNGITALLPHAAVEISLGIIVPLLLMRFAGRKLRYLYYWHGSTSAGSGDDLRTQEIVKKPS